MNNPASSGSRVLKADDYDNWQNARDIVAAAQARAAEIIASAEQAYRQSQQKGYADGVKAARKDCLDQVYQTVESCTDYVRNCEAGLAQVAIDAIEKVISSCDHDSVTRKLVQQGLQRMLGSDELFLRVPNGKIAYYQTLLSGDQVASRVRFIECANQADNECLLESSFGVIKISLADQVDAIKQHIQEVLPGKVPSTGSQ